jgi:hypothetical protein
MHILKSPSNVILSVAGSARSAVPAESKDPDSGHAAVSASRPLPGFARPDGPFDFAQGRLGRLSLHNILVLLILLSALASAQTLTGTVKNSTTGKLAAGDEVVLMSLAQGMEESARTRTDAKGNFSFKLDDPQSPHLVRAIHQGVTYHTMAPPGATSVEVEVYDAGKKVDGIEIVADIMRIQAVQGQLEIMRAFAVENASKPPRTQMNDRNLEFYVPQGALVVEGQAMSANGQPVASAPVPVDNRKTRYAFQFPLRPGTTQFNVAYRLAYSGTATVDPRSIYPLQHFVAILPRTMQFSAAPGTKYQSMNDPQQPDANVQVASGVSAGQSLAFRISGEGTLQARQEAGGAPGEGGSGQSGNRPGGGLGPPIDAPNPLEKYQVYILGGLGLVLAVGAFLTSRWQPAAGRSESRSQAMGAGQPAIQAAFKEPAAPRASGAGTEAPQTQASTSSALLEGLKEELFQLELEHKQGRISQQEYEKAKAALDETLERALKRKAGKA